MLLNVLYSYHTPEFYIHNLIRFFIAITVGIVAIFIPGLMGLGWNKYGLFVRVLFGILLSTLILWIAPKQYPNLDVTLEKQDIIFFMPYSREESTIDQIHNFEIGIVFRMTYIGSKNTPKSSVIESEKVTINFDKKIKADKKKYVILSNGVINESIQDAEKKIIKPNTITTHETLFLTEKGNYKWGDFINALNTYSKEHLEIIFTSTINNKEIKVECIFNPKEKRENLAKNNKFSTNSKSLSINCENIK